MESYTKNELDNFLSNEEIFLEKIQKTNGYFINYLEKEKIYPNKNWLLNSKNILSYNYLKKYYTLTEQDKLSINILFNGKNNEIIILNELQVLNYLKKDQSFPKNAEFPLEIFYKNINVFTKHLHSYHDFQKVGALIIKEKMPIDDFIKLDMSLLKNLIDVFYSYPEFFSEEKYKKIYKEAFLISNKSILNINSESYSYQFTKKDIPFVKKLIKNLSYSDIQDISNIAEILSVTEFMKYSDNYTMTMIEKEDIQKNKDGLKLLFKEKLKNEYDPLSFLIKNTSSIENIQEIFNEEELLDIMKMSEEKNSGKLAIEYISGDNPSKMNLYNYLLRIYINYLEKKDKDFTITDISNFKNAYKILKIRENNIHYDLTKQELENYYKITNNLKQKSNNLLLNNLNNKTLNDFFDFEVNLNKKTKNENIGNPNVFLFLLNKLNKPYIKEEEKASIYLTLNTVLNKITQIPDINKKNEYLFCIKECSDYYQNKLKHFEIFRELEERINNLLLEYKVGNAINILNNKEDSFNVFKYETNGLHYSIELNNIIFNSRKNIYNDIIEKNIIINDSMIKNIIIDAKIDDLKSIVFLKEYIDKNKSYIISNEDIYKLIMNSPIQEQIFLKEDFNEDILAVKNIKLLEKESKEIKELVQLINKVKKLHYENKFEKEELYKKIINEDFNISNLKNIFNLENNNTIQKLTNEEAYYYRDLFNVYINDISNKVDGLESKVSNQYLSKISDEYLNNNQFKEINDLYNRYSNKQLKEKLCNFLSNLNFTDWEKNLKDKFFIKVINDHTLNFNSYDYNQKIYKIKVFSSEENNKILKTLYQGNDKLLQIIPHECSEDIKQFLLKKAPNELITNNNLRPYGNIIKKEYSKEQVVTLYSNNYKKNKSYFKHKDINFKPFAFFNDNFNNSICKTKDDYDKKINILNFFKEKDPILYLMMLHPGSWDTGLSFAMESSNKMNISREEYYHYFLKANLDLNVFSNAVEKIIDIITNNDISKIEKDNYLQLIRRIEDKYISRESKNKGLNQNYQSEFNPEEIEQLYTIYMKNEPLSLLLNENFCAIDDISLFIEKNVLKNLTQEEIKNFFKPNIALPIDKLLDYKISQENILKISEKIIIYLNETKQTNLLEWLNFEVETAKLLNEIDYGEKLKFLQNNSTSNMIIDMLIKNDDFITVLNKVTLHNELDNLLIKESANKKIRNKI